MVTPIVKHKIVKKRTLKFVRHQVTEFIRIRNTSWRKPRGIDSRARRRNKSQVKHARIGYGTNNKFKFVLPNGFLKFNVNNVAVSFFFSLLSFYYSQFLFSSFRLHIKPILNLIYLVCFNAIVMT